MKSIIAFTGKAETGKSTAAKYLREHYGFEGTNLTDPMDEMLMPLLYRMGVPASEIMPRLTGNMKNEPIPGFEWLTGRKMKQAMGLDWRDAVSKPLNDGSEKTDRGLFHMLWIKDNKNSERLVHEQIRYEFEARLIQADGGYVIRMINPEEVSNDDHESEKDDFDVDETIENQKNDLQALYAKLDTIMGRHGLNKLTA